MKGLYYERNGKLSLKIGKTFSTLFEKRQSGDYDDFVYCDQSLVEELYPQASLFIDSVKEILTKP